MSVEPAETLKIAEVARDLRVSTKTVKRAIDAGHLRASQLAERGCWRISPEAVAEWIELRANRPRQERAIVVASPVEIGGPRRVRGRVGLGALSVPRRSAA